MLKGLNNKYKNSSINNETQNYQDKTNFKEKLKTGVNNRSYKTIVVAAGIWSPSHFVALI